MTEAGNLEFQFNGEKVAVMLILVCQSVFLVRKRFVQEQSRDHVAVLSCAAQGSKQMLSNSQRNTRQDDYQCTVETTHEAVHNHSAEGDGSCRLKVVNYNVIILKTRAPVAK